jgi:hypothetical protein
VGRRLTLAEFERVAKSASASMRPHRRALLEKSVKARQLLRDNQRDDAAGFLDRKKSPFEDIDPACVKPAIEGRFFLIGLRASLSVQAVKGWRPPKAIDLSASDGLLALSLLRPLRLGSEAAIDESSDSLRPRQRLAGLPLPPLVDLGDPLQMGAPARQPLALAETRPDLGRCRPIRLCGRLPSRSVYPRLLTSMLYCASRQPGRSRTSQTVDGDNLDPGVGRTPNGS